ncbi:protein lin-9 homolog isoform X3 [Lineus longissimus]|uniref:protein lin-9 homolog isoform X3 n=1 Tax=Lineus longissimus TaxID=88925 RepID=UPI002B4CA458
MADEALENSSAEALVSLKEGKGNSFTPPRRANPPRMKKKNRLIFNDDEETELANMRSPRKQSKLSSPVSRIRMKGSLSTPDKKAAQATGVRLRNLLKLPKAHKWVCYEWFFSNLDIPLFIGENDFCICLKESFPQLKLSKMRRAEWSILRRLMGKPRRCSPSFFLEERQALNAKRERIRLLQQRKVTELKNLKDLPEEVPMPLVIGTKVTARLRKPQDGLFTGSIDALDTVNNTYRVTFERAGLGTHSIPDYEVLSNEPQETMPLSSFQQKHRPRQNIFTPPRFIPGLQSPQLENDPLLGGSPARGHVLSMEGGTYGGFPIKFLVLVTRLSKILSIKKDWINKLKNMNTEAEKKMCRDMWCPEMFNELYGKSFEEPIDMDFQKKYASVVLELETLNRDLNEYLSGVQQYCSEIAPDHGIRALEQPNELKKKCEREADDTVARNNAAQGKRCVKNDKSLKLVAKLTSLLYQIKNFAENDLNSFEFKSLQDSLSEIKDTLEPGNISVFQNNVEIHVNHIQSGLSQMGNLSAFSETAAFSI